MSEGIKQSNMRRQRSEAKNKEGNRSMNNLPMSIHRKCTSSIEKRRYERGKQVRFLQAKHESYLLVWFFFVYCAVFWRINQRFTSSTSARYVTVIPASRRK